MDTHPIPADASCPFCGDAITPGQHVQITLNPSDAGCIHEACHQERRLSRTYNPEAYLGLAVAR